MRSVTLPILASLLLVSTLCGAHGQTAPPEKIPDPYRSFVGSWSGTIPESAEKMPKTMKMIVTEESDGSAMRWDYTVGIKGEKGYTHDTEWISLYPANAKMLLYWKGRPIKTYKTQGLMSFARYGSGAFSAEIVWGKSAAFDRITFALQPDSLTYLWETSRDGKNYALYSKFKLKRDHPTGSASANDTISNKEN